MKILWFIRKRNEYIKKDTQICNFCNIEKKKRYIFKNQENEKKYFITFLKKEYFFKRYSYCQICHECIYDNFNRFMTLNFDGNNNTMTVCNLCFYRDIIPEHILKKDKID